MLITHSTSSLPLCGVGRVKIYDTNFCEPNSNIEARALPRTGCQDFSIAPESGPFFSPLGLPSGSLHDRCSAGTGSHQGSIKGTARDSVRDHKAGRLAMLIIVAMYLWISVFFVVGRLVPSRVP